MLKQDHKLLYSIIAALVMQHRDKSCFKELNVLMHEGTCICK